MHTQLSALGTEDVDMRWTQAFLYKPCESYTNIVNTSYLAHPTLGSQKVVHVPHCLGKKKANQ